MPYLLGHFIKLIQVSFEPEEGRLMARGDEPELQRLDRELEEVKRPLRRSQEAALKKLVVLSNKLKDMIAAANKRYKPTKEMAVNLMRALGLKLKDYRSLGLRAELRFNMALKDDEKGAAQLERLRACFGRLSEEWVKSEEVTITRYSYTEKGKAAIDAMSIESLFTMLDCLSAPDEHRVPAFYVGPIPRGGREPQGEEGEGVGGEGE